MKANPDEIIESKTEETNILESTPTQNHSLDIPFPIVGVAASAGGLEAYIELIKSLPADTGMGFVLIQHLSPDHKSLLSEILSRETSMTVSEAQEGMLVEKNRIYIIPPNTKMILSEGVLRLSPREKISGKYMPGDAFLISLAAECGSQAIAVILSGGDGDGSLGLIAIKEAGGITFAQSEGTAGFDGMPSSAVATGLVDFILPPQKIAEELVRLSQQPSIDSQSTDNRLENSPQSVESENALNAIFTILLSSTGVDFREYKSTTIGRRIQKRILLHKLERLEDYVRYLRENPNEVKALYEELLIHVTSFFRDPEVFLILKEQILPQIIQNKLETSSIRIWVPGCATGEEVYSIAICLLELLENKTNPPLIQIFATDISETAIAVSRSGIYKSNQMGEVSPEQCYKFFNPTPIGSYQIKKHVRALCVFARQDLNCDPPFSNLDLISCRNVLIYLGESLQKRLMPIFNYSLIPNGFLLLGKSESIGKSSELFDVIDKKCKIYAKKLTANRLNLSFGISNFLSPTLKEPKQMTTESSNDFNLGQYANQIILNYYAHVGVVIDDKMRVLQARGEINLYLKIATGEVSLNLFSLVLEELSAELRTAISQSKRTETVIKKEGLRIETSDRTRIINFEVIPFQSPTAERYFLILFEESTYPVVSPRIIAEESEPQDLAVENKRLKQELSATQDYIQSLAVEQEKIHQDLKVANEEILSSNEELQSTNEELETAKEEIQSANEELNITNEELRSLNFELHTVNNDLTNLLSSINIPILMLTNDLRIRLFTPLAQTIYNFIPSDIGRPLNNISGKISTPNLEALILEVLTNLSVKEIEVQTQEGYWYNLRIRPYRTIENQIDGVVLVFMDIDRLKRSAAALDLAREQAEVANRAKDEFLSNLSHELRNPLTIILGWLELIRLKNLDKAETDRALELVNKSATILNRLIEDILDVSRIKSGKLSLVTSLINLETLISNGVDSVLLSANAKNIELIAQLDPVVVVGDRNRLLQVVWNLLSNAIKFSPVGGRVEISLQTRENFAEIRVKDNGIGIHPDFLPYLFERFRQGDSSSTKANQGLGLGLSIVLHIVELHNGTIQIESLGEGLGTTVTVRLPTSVKLPNLLTETLNASDSKKLSLGGVRILAVDDEPIMGKLIEAILQGFGAETVIVTSAKGAMSAIAENPSLFDVLISDLGMPGEDGYSLISKVRALSAEAGGQIPAIAITGFTDEQDRKRVLNAGFQIHLSKPINSEQLLAAIVSLLEK